MSPAEELISSIRSVLALLSVIPGFWVAGRILRRAGLWLAAPGALPGTAGRSAPLALWLGLGALFTAPVIDIVDLLSSFFLVFAPWTLMTRFSLLWGTAPYRLHIILTSLLLLASYAFGIWAGRALLGGFRGRLFPQQPPTAIEKGFYLLTLGSLVSSFTKMLAGGILDMHIPSLYGPLYNIGLYGPAGYAAGWAIALAVLVLVVLFLGSRLVGIQDHETQ